MCAHTLDYITKHRRRDIENILPVPMRDYATTIRKGSFRKLYLIFNPKDGTGWIHTLMCREDKPIWGLTKSSIITLT